MAVFNNVLNEYGQQEPWGTMYYIHFAQLPLPLAVYTFVSDVFASV